jgi:nucleoid DNA-binding protein
MLKKPIKKTATNQSQIKQAYELVAQDLLSALKKAKDGAKIKLGELGTFQKKLARVRNSFGVYRYYRINFQTSSLLKKEIDK